MESEERKLNVSADHAEPAFFADTITVSHSENKFIFDFTQATPRFDNIGDERVQSMTIKHKTLIIDPVFAKDILRVLEENIGKYEKQFGDIKIQKRKETRPKAKPAASDTVSYIG